MNLKISGRLILGFGIMSAILIGATGITIVQVSKINSVSNRIIELRMPTANSSAAMVNNINASLAALRGYMLTGAPKFKNGRAEVWGEIDKTTAKMDELSKSWTNPKNVENLQVFKGVLNEFRVAQAKVEGIAKTIDEQPATKILVQDAAPLATTLVSEITKIITLERDLPATPMRKNLLGMMADTRGTTARGLASIRAFLLTGNQKFKKSFDVMWKKNGVRFGQLKQKQSLLSPAQLVAFKKFDAARTNFLPLPPKMFAIRGSKKWNMANYTLVTEAAPRAGKLMNMLTGIKDAKGVRQGGMARNQSALLQRDADLNTSQVHSLQTFEWILLAVGIGSAVVIVLLSVRSIVGPVTEMTSAMGELAEGKLETEVPALDKTDEIGEMAQAVQVFKDNAIRVKQMEAEQAEQARVAEAEKKAALSQMADDFEKSVGGVVASVSSASTEMQSSAQSMATTAEQASEQSSTVAAASEQASANVQTVATAAEELSSSINEISRQVQESSRIAGGAVDEANNADEMIQSLASAANKIGEVVSLITDIAEQTNLLALNATIEAARAGDAGKGFAVVASEVKNLANQTAKATEEISAQINGIQDASQNAVGAIQRIGSTISDINEIAATIASAVEEQGAATQEIARNVERAANGTSEVNSNISGVTTAVGETGHAAGEILNASSELSQQSEVLKTEVDQFLAQVRAG